jgi:DNA-binding response OmpR family regulator
VTETESSILELLMQNPQRAFPRTELTEKTLRCEPVGLNLALAARLQKLRQKIEVGLAHPYFLAAV